VDFLSYSFIIAYPFIREVRVSSGFMRFGHLSFFNLFSTAQNSG
jgi:hypothetical protein